MQTAAALPQHWPTSDYDPVSEMMKLSEQTFRMLAVAQALVQSNRHVDVDGLQHLIGVLCAKALDLPPSQTGFARLELQRLVATLDTLRHAMRQNAA